MVAIACNSLSRISFPCGQKTQPAAKFLGNLALSGLRHAEFGAMASGSRSGCAARSGFDWSRARPSRPKTIIQ